MSDQPAWVCRTCGLYYGKRAKYYDDASTYHEGDSCGVCGTETMVTEPRDFGYLKPEWKHHKRKP